MSFRTIALVTASSVGVAGCAQIANSPINPLNWFGGSGGTVAADPADPSAVVALPALTPQDSGAAVLDLRVPVERVTALRVDRTPDGLIVTADGAAAAPGYFNAGLVPTAVEGGRLILEFRAEAPGVPQGGQTGITAGFIIDNDLAAGIGGVTVLARQNRLSRSF